MTDLERYEWDAVPLKHRDVDERDLAERVDNLEALVAALAVQLCGTEPLPTTDPPDDWWTESGSGI